MSKENNKSSNEHNNNNNKAEYYLLNAKLCRLVQANPCMYDRSSPHYAKKDYMDRAWAVIAREVNDTVASCKERWRNIRTAYARSVNIYKTPCGPNRHKRYYLHDELQFLTKHISPGLPSLPIRILTPTELEENHTLQSIDESDDNCTFQITIGDSSSSSPPPSAPTEREEEEHVPTPEPDYVDFVPPTKKRRQNYPEEPPKEPVSLLRTSSKRNLDFEFLQSLLPEMNAMNTRQKILFKGKIFVALEEVFSDNRDFPARKDPMFSEKSFLNPISSGKKSSARSVGTENCTDRRERLPEETPQNCCTSMTMAHLHQPAQNDSSFVKQETIIVEAED